MLSKKCWVNGSAVHMRNEPYKCQTDSRSFPLAGRASSDMMSYMFTTPISVNTSVKAVCSVKHIIVLQDVLQVFVKSRL